MPLDLLLEHGGARNQALMEHLEVGGLGCYRSEGLRLLLNEVGTTALGTTG